MNLKNKNIDNNKKILNSRFPDYLKKLFPKKAQTATEYVIVLAVVIVIAVVVANLISGGSGSASEVSKRVDNAKSSIGNIALLKHVIGTDSSRFVIQNNNPYTIKIDTLSFDNIGCETSNLPKTLRIGDSAQITCTNISGTAGEKYSEYVIVGYTNSELSASYETNLGKVSGKVAGDLIIPAPVNISAFTSIVINETNSHVWQAGDSGDHVDNGACYNGSDGCLAWDLTGSYNSNNCSDLNLPDGNYPACSYCYNLALCTNGSFDNSDSPCTNEDYGGVVPGYGVGDWRVPTYNGSGDYNLYESNLIGYFKSINFTEHTPWDYYWTGNTHVSVAGLAYFVHLAVGVVRDVNKTFGGFYRVRCVSDQ